MSALTEIDHRLFNTLEPGDLFLHVPVFNHAVQININRPHKVGLLDVVIDQTVTVRRAEDEPLQIRVNNRRPAFANPVAEVIFLPNEEGLWQPDLNLDMKNESTFFQFANLVARFARAKQAKT